MTTDAENILLLTTETGTDRLIEVLSRLLRG